MKTRLIIVRHAEAEGNTKRVFNGWTDAPLTEKGRMQARKVAERLKDEHIDVIYSSSLKRAIHTAGYISDLKSLPIIRTDKLKEIDGGDWEGQNWDIIPDLWPEQNRTWEHEPHKHQMPNGESMTAFQERLISEIEYIIKNNEGRDICIVTHGTAIRALLCYFEGCDLEQMLNVSWHDNTSVTIIDHEDGKYSIVLEGDASHLGRELSTIQNQEWWERYQAELKKRRNKN